MNPRTLRIIGYVFMALAAGLVAIALLQEAGVVSWLDDPATGAIGPAIIGLMLGLLAKKREEEAS
ncbi:MAG: hypothetical protein WBA68_13505 [Alteraurantiacibacter sp.]